MPSSLQQSPVQSLKKLADLIPQCMLHDQQRLRRKWQSLSKRLQDKSASDKRPVDQLQLELIEAMERSLTLVEQRRGAVPEIEFPEALPIADRREEISDAIRDNQVVVIAGETGSGKTTQIPKICLELGRGVQGLIGHTQPRRLAARTVAARVADELKTPLGEGVGYQVRFNDQVSERSHIKLMTDGILLAEVQRDRFLSGYDTIIIDEAHERSLNIDFLLGYLKQLLPKRPDLKLIITSATIDLERFSKHFDDAPIIEVSGRTYPVELRYRPLEDASDDGDLASGIQGAIEELCAAEAARRGGASLGDILVFLSGEADIREVSRKLRDANLPHLEVLPLYARLSNAEQNKIFSLEKRRGRRVVLATNVAETSLTVPGIRYVIDPGFARISRYSYRTKVQRLPIEAISQASANQRKGRCGRVAEGICIRLYSEEDFLARPEFTDPEIQRTNLASVILQMLAMRIGAIESFPFVDPPDGRMIRDGFKLLEELGAVAVDNKTRDQRLSKVGQTLSRFSVDPKLSRMLIAASELDCVEEILIIVSALSVQDPRERPADKRQAADEKHRVHWHQESDFLSYVNLWQHYEQQRQELSQSQLRKYCKRNFLAYMKMREWRDIHHQLKITARELGYKRNQEPASYESVHRALLTGLLGQVASLDEDKLFLGARNRRMRIFPGSSLSKKPPKWIAAAEIAETSQLFARCCARIQPEWLLGINDSLLKYHYSEPHWQQRSGRVMAFEKVSLYGLPLRDRNKVHYGPIDPVVSRELLIRSGLVEGQLLSKAPFFKHNQNLLKEIGQLEDKSRRRDILVEEQQLFQFYDERLPVEITTARQFESFCKKTAAEQPKLLFLDKGLLMQHAAGNVTETQFPTTVRCEDLQFALSYLFEPGNNADGVTVSIPLALLNRVNPARFDWLVPGMLRDKCIALVKQLPKALRKQLVPVPDYIDRALEGVVADDVPLLDILTKRLRGISGVEIPAQQWQAEALDDYYRMNIRILDERGKKLAEGRDFAALQQQFEGAVSESVQQHSKPAFKQQKLQRWDFGELPEQYQFVQAGVTITSYPALMDKGDHSAIELVDYPEQALLESRRGVVRLLMLAMPQQLKLLRKDLLTGNQFNLQMAAIKQQRGPWLEDLLQAAFQRLFLAADELPRTQQQFDDCLQRHRGELVAEANKAADLLMTVVAAYTRLKKALKGANQLAWAMAVSDINDQLAQLFAEGFIADTPWDELQQYPRYLKAIEQRLDKLRGQLPKDRQLSASIATLSAPLWKVWQGNFVAQARDPRLFEYRWLLEEYRVSLFAQPLGTRQPVSEKRLKKLLAQLKDAQLLK